MSTLHSFKSFIFLDHLLSYSFQQFLFTRSYSTLYYKVNKLSQFPIGSWLESSTMLPCTFCDPLRFPVRCAYFIYTFLTISAILLVCYISVSWFADKNWRIGRIRNSAAWLHLDHSTPHSFKSMGQHCKERLYPSKKHIRTIQLSNWTWTK